MKFEQSEMKSVTPEEPIFVINKSALPFEVGTALTFKKDGMYLVTVIGNKITVDEVQHCENVGEDYDAVDQFVCSKCGIELQGWYRVERDMDDGEETHHEYVMRYCPNCGAKMDGGVNDG